MARQLYWIVTVLVCHQARPGCHGAPVGDSASASGAGAGQSFVALDLSLDQGAQRDFDLFYPELQETTAFTATTPTTVQVTRHSRKSKLKVHFDVFRLFHSEL